MLQNHEQADEAIYKFESEEVAITIRAQSSPVHVRKLSLPKLEDLPANADGFKPSRLVINFEVVDEEENIPPEFAPPFELQVRYTAEDLGRARDAGGSLTLWFFDGIKWNPFTEQKHRFRLIPDRLRLQTPLNDEEGGYGIAYITKWYDPPVGWSP